MIKYDNNSQLRIPLGMHRSVERATPQNPAFRTNATKSLAKKTI